MVTINNSGELDGREIEMILFAAREYNIDRIQLNIIRDGKMLDKFGGKDIELQAMLVNNPIPHSYNLHIRPNIAGVFDIVCHEMVHLHQYERGDLEVNIPEKKFNWKNKEYPASVSYMDRPWEREAFEEQRRLKKAYKESLK